MTATLGGQRDILLFIASRFQSGRIRFLLTGSLAVSYYGYPRATHDIDFVVIAEASARSALHRIVSGFGKDFMQNPKTLTGALYTLYHTNTGIKIDLWLVEAADFARKWARRHTMTLGRQRIALVSPEDLILTKLTWCQEVWSDRHFRDCVGMWQVQKDKLDESYCAKQAREMGLEALWEKMEKGSY